MLQNLLVIIYLFIHQWYTYLVYLFFRLVGKITFVYYVNSQTWVKTNITFSYYTGIGLQKYSRGIFYAIMHDHNGTNQIAFDGHISTINNFKPFNNLILPKRKQIILLNHQKPINIDLAILDKYWMNLTNYYNSVTNLNQILKLMDIRCTDIVFIKKFPFSKTIMQVADLDINDLYQ